MALKKAIYRGAFPPSFIFPGSRLSFITVPASAKSFSRYGGPESFGQGYSSFYEVDQPTRGPLGAAARVAPRLTPKRLKEHLDKFVVGQERAKKMLSVAVYNQYQRQQQMQRREDEERERLAKIARTNIAYERSRRHPVEDEYEGQEATVDIIDSEHPRDPPIGAAGLEDNTPVTIEKSNIMVIGPSGVGKTMMIKILARVLEVPFSMSDCTPFTQAGYIGEDAEVCVQRLLAAADYDVARAEHGIICLDEVDKLAMAKVVNGKDVSGEGVQQALLKIIEGTSLQITAKPERGSQRPSGNSNNFGSNFSSSPNSSANAGPSKPETYTIRTDNILFICSGAFVGLQKIILDRISRGSIGFGAPIRSSSDSSNQLTLSASESGLFRKYRNVPLSTSSSPNAEAEYNPLDLAEPNDFQKYGLIPEFIGRIPITTALSALSLSDLVRILTEPRNSLIQQYTALFLSSGIDLHISTGALHEIASQGHKMGTGARGLRSATEALLWPIMYEVPGSSVRYVLITEQAAKYEVEPEYWSRGQKQRFNDAIKREEGQWAFKEAVKEGKKASDIEAASFEQFREQAKSGM